MASFMKNVEHLKIELEEIKLATNNFDDNKVIGGGGFGKVYKGILTHFEGRSMVAIKRLDRKFGQGGPEFFKEIMTLSCCTHENLISLLGFCSQGDEKILVYEHASRGSLDRILNDATLTWTQRLNICLGAAKGLSFLHDPNGTQQRVLHRDIKSANILLDENLNAKVSDFGFSRISPANQQYTVLFTDTVGTLGYCDPLYMDTYELTKESDVYSFGVVLFEVLCGRVCYKKSDNKLMVFVASWKKSYEQKKLDEIIFQELMQQMDPRSLETFVDIAYQCLQKSREQRPTLSVVVEKLKMALQFQELRYYKPSMYEEILRVADPPLIYRSINELKAILTKGFPVNKGKTLFSINDKEEHCERIYIESCLDPNEISYDSLKNPSNYNNSRFPGGRCYEKEFRAHVTANLLSLYIAYTVNLVFRYKNEWEVKKHKPIKYKLDGETKLFIVYNTYEREDGWIVAPLYQFTSDHKTAYHEIIYYYHPMYTLQVAGFEFQPLEEKVERNQVLEYQDIVKAASQSLLYNSLEELKVILTIGVYLNEYKTWFSLNENEDHCEMVSIADCLIPNEDLISQYTSDHNSRFPAGFYQSKTKGFKVHIRTQFLSPLITYTMNLVLAKNNLERDQRYVDLKYKVKGETQVSTVYLATKSHDGCYHLGEVYQFTGFGRIVDLEIEFFDHMYDLAVEGILFQPLENVEHDQVLKDDSVQWTIKEHRHSDLLKMFNINKGQQWFSGDKHGKKCLMLSAIDVIKNRAPSFQSFPESRFREVAVINTVSFEIVKEIKDQVVSPQTTYAVYLVYKLAQDQSTFESPLQVKNKSGPYVEYPYIYLLTPTPTPVKESKLDRTTHNSLNRPKLNAVPRQRKDGWMEVKVWEFQSLATTPKGTRSIHLSLEHPMYKNLSGLIIHGIELRPI